MAANDTTAQICRFYARGACTEGNKCKFSHDGGRKIDAPAQTEEDGRKPCRFGGACKRPDCRYSHVGGRKIDAPAQTEEDGRKPCRFGGACNRPDCRYSHVRGRRIDAPAKLPRNASLFVPQTVEEAMDEVGKKFDAILARWERTNAPDVKELTMFVEGYDTLALGRPDGHPSHVAALLAHELATDALNELDLEAFVENNAIADEENAMSPDMRELMAYDDALPVIEGDASLHDPYDVEGGEPDDEPDDEPDGVLRG